MGWRIALVGIAVLAACGEAEPDVILPGDPFPPGAPARAWFRDVTTASGVASELGAPVSRVLGATVADFNGDGLLDIVTVGGRRPALLLENRGNLQFEDVSAERALFPPDFTHAVAAADIDGDRWPDLLLAGDGFVRVLRNRNGLSFEDVTPSGMTFEGSARGLLATDFDGDGQLDIYAATSVVSLIGAANGAADHLYMGRGAFEFEDVTARATIDTAGWSWTAAALDADGDGDLDLYVANDMLVVDSGERPLPEQPVPYEVAPATDRLFLNQGTDADGVPVFTDASDAAGVAAPRSTMGIVAADFSGDGVTDLYLSDDGRNDLLVGGAPGVFADDDDLRTLGAASRQDVDCRAPTLDDPSCWLVSWGAVYEDIDLDGQRDVVSVNAALGGTLQPAVVWRGTGGVGADAFEAVQTELGWLAGRGLVAADLDNDGDLDLVVAVGDTLRVFENTAADGGWLRVQLRGATDAASGSGARVTAVLSDGRRLERTIGSGGSVHSWQPLEAHFGLGDASVDAVEIAWPSGARQTVAVGARNRRIDIDQANPR